MNKTVLEMSALELGAAIRKGNLALADVAKIYIDNIKKTDPHLHAFLYMDEESILRRVQEVEEGMQSGRYTGPLAGVPIAIKDNICTKDMPTTCGSKMLENFVPGYQAEAVRRLEDAGMIILGKTNMDEFAMGSTTETSAYQVTCNPWNTAYVPGGSSGGSCVAVAAGEAPLALGSDTGGSVRQPAAYCGVVGLKPTYGRVSRYGLVAYASSMDQIGPIARNVTDCKALYEVIAGYDKKDSTSAYIEEECYKQEGLRIAVPTSYEKAESDIVEAIRKSIVRLEQSGAKVEYVSMPMTDYATQTYYVIACAEASSNLARFDGVKYGYRSEATQNLHQMYRQSRTEGFGEEVKKRIMVGAYTLSEGFYDAYYKKALKVKSLIKKEHDRILAQYDCILSPVTPIEAPRLGESLEEPLRMYQADAYTVAANLTGLPAISVPCGFSKNGLPIGLQFVGKSYQEERLFMIAKQFEDARGKFPSVIAKQYEGKVDAQ